MLKEEQDKKKIEEELKSCTFHPQINKKSSRSGSRYMSETPKKRFYEESPSFVPKIKGPSKNMRSANEYIKQDPFERLSRPKELYQPELEEPESPIKSFTPTLSYYGNSFSTRPFFERQALYELMKQEKKEIAQYQSPKKPQINTRSRKLVKNNFFERNEEMIRKKIDSKADYPDIYPFQPTITDSGKMKRNRSYNEMTYGDSKKKIEKIEYLKEITDEKLKESVNPDIFQSKSYANVKSKLQLLNDPQTYIDRIKSQQKTKEIHAQIDKEEKNRQEMNECTYLPTIIDEPIYIKQIARNMAMIKAEIQINNKPLKADWR